MWEKKKQQHGVLFEEAQDWTTQLKAILPSTPLLLQGSRPEKGVLGVDRNIKSRPVMYAKVVCTDGESPPKEFVTKQILKQALTMPLLLFLLVKKIFSRY